MKERTLRILSVTVCLAAAATVVLSSCGKDTDEQLVFEKGGKIYYRTSEGDDAYELVTDKNGETVVDSEGNMLWKVTDANGEEQTHPVSFPAYIEDGKSISCQQFSMKIPSGWENTGKLEIHLRDKDGQRGFDYSFEENDSVSVHTAQKRIDELTELFSEKIKSGTLQTETKDTQIGGRDAVRLDMLIKDEEGNKSYLQVYYVDLPTGCMVFSCFDKTAETPDKGYDFKALLDTIDYRV